MRNLFGHLIKRRPRDASGRTLAQREAARRKMRTSGVVEGRSLACRSGNHSEQCLDGNPGEFLPVVGCLCPCHDEALR